MSLHGEYETDMTCLVSRESVSTAVSPDFHFAERRFFCKDENAPVPNVHLQCTSIALPKENRPLLVGVR